MHESQMQKKSSFITLTIAPEYLQEVYDLKKGNTKEKEKFSQYSICKRSMQKFMKRLRKNTGQNIRYFACGEYGDKNNRPHYHAIIFGFDFPDKTIYTQTKNGDYLYRSATLEKSWKYGFSLIGEVTFQSAAYVARYVMKKRKGDPETIDPLTGKTNAEYYMLEEPETGEIFKLQQEFALMSRNPGLGKDWFEKYKSDTNKDFLTINGNKMSLPKYYDSLLKVEDLADYENRKRKRKKNINPAEQTPDRLQAKKQCVEARSNQLIRQLL